MDKLTGAKIGEKVVSLSLVVVLSAMGISGIEMIKNEDTNLNTKIEQLVYGYKNNPTIDNKESINNIENVNVDDYIYLPTGSQSAPQPVGYIQNDVDSSEIIIKNNTEYKLDRTVTFYTDYDNVKDIRNKFAGHLKNGEIMEFSSQGNGMINYVIYKPIIKENSRVL